MKITFDSFVKGLIAIILAVGIYLLLLRLSSVLLPFFLAWLIAYLLFPLVRFFQYRCHLHFRMAGIVCAFAVVGGLLALIGWLVVPPMIDETVRVKDLIVEYVSNNLTRGNVPMQIDRFIRQHFDAETVKTFITQEGFLDNLKNALPAVWQVVAQGIDVVGGVVQLTMVVLYTFFILIDYEALTTGWVKLLPHRSRRFATQLVTDIETSMNRYFRGQAIVAFCVGVLFSIGFLIIHFPMAIPLGLFIGLLNMVPYLQLLGFVPTILLAIIKSADTGQNFWAVLLAALVVFAVVQIIQDALLTPRIMGKVMGLNSAIILLSLSIWGSLLGILGMVIALPITTLLISYYQRYVVKKSSE